MVEEHIGGLWSLEFFSNVVLPTGSGVAVLRNGRVLGGDTRYFYVGEYAVSGNLLSATVRLSHYFGPPEAILGFGEKFTLKVKGNFEPTTFMISGFVEENPSVTIDVHLTRRAELS